jgi:hypothetical protein
MKYSNEILINLPMNRVIELFDNPQNMLHWQPNLVSFEHLSGTPGQPGAKAKLTYKRGKQRNEMIETVTVRDLPKEFSGTYELKGTICNVKNSFEAIDANTTKYSSDTEFILNGFVMKAIGFLMPGAFKKQTQQYMVYFKTFAEKQG